ncbi:hypothetical protein AWJ20_5182 [Sugiyamaella lignohabitans]|uniref:N-acetyltransferase domain-containing protein n=1 Tax=Sugiyamaella lignohabitans TaxID=796027 RepID=A0A167ELK6_9ASCO|nr:uncharacterized protein AWJ20_5182 [Sugiyamaella lignohabitans]ANB14221.1 hypothetical protein AWJ20_5182 [Sugiyamaella lignohabitans]
MTVKETYEIDLFGDYYLSPVRLSDSESTYRAFIRPEITDNLAGPATDNYTLQDAIDFLSSCEKQEKEVLYPLVWGIRSRKVSSPTLIGCIDIRPSQIVKGQEGHIPDPNLKEPFAIFGFWLDTDYRRKGITSAALRALVYEVGVKQYKISHFYGNCFAGNIGSRKTFESVGFKFVQLAKDGAIKLVPYQVRDEERFALILDQNL